MPQPTATTTQDALLQYAPPKKRWPLWLRLTLTSVLLCLAAAILLITWAGRIYYVGPPIDGYGGFVEYLRVTHTRTPTGISNTYTFHWGHFAICWAISVPVIAAAAWSARQLLRKQVVQWK